MRPDSRSSYERHRKEQGTHYGRTHREECADHWALGTIGQPLVARYAEAGASIIALDRPDARNPQEVLDGIAPGVRYVGWDLNDLPALETKATALAEEVGGIDVLVNNAALVIFKQHEEFSIQSMKIRSGSTPRPSSSCPARARSR
jgi:hypothetical protein